jgi:hypothetical protein
MVQEVDNMAERLHDRPLEGAIIAVQPMAHAEEQIERRTCDFTCPCGKVNQSPPERISKFPPKLLEKLNFRVGSERHLRRPAGECGEQQQSGQGL